MPKAALETAADDGIKAWSPGSWPDTSAAACPGQLWRLLSLLQSDELSNPSAGSAPAAWWALCSWPCCPLSPQPPPSPLHNLAGWLQLLLPLFLLGAMLQRLQPPLPRGRPLPSSWPLSSLPGIGLPEAGIKNPLLEIKRLAHAESHSHLQIPA